MLTLASIVEREAVLDEERPLIAGVYQNRIDGLPGIKNKILNADPTVIYANDTLELDEARLRRVAEVLVLDAARGPDEGGRGAARARRATRRTRRRASSRARSHADPRRRSTRRSSPTRRTSTSTSWPSPTATATHAFAKDNGRVPEAPQEVRLHSDRSAGRTPADFAPLADASDQRTAGPRPTAPPGPHASPGSGHGSPRPASTPTSASVREHMRYLTGFALGDGEEKVAGHVRAVPRRRRRGRRARRLALHDPGAPRGAGCAGRRGLPRPAAALAGAGRRRSAPAAWRSRPAFVSHATWGRLGSGGARRRAGPGRGLGRGRPRDEGARRARAGRGRLRRRRPRAGDAAARDPPGRHRGRAGAPAGMADADRRRRGARLRRRVPGRTGGGAAARLAGRPAGARRGRAAVRLRRPGRGLPQRHDPDAVRRRAGGARPRRSTSWSPAPRRRRSRPSRPRSRRRGADGALPERPGARRRRPRRHRRRPAMASTSATAPGTGSASPRTRRRSLGQLGDRDAAAEPDGLLGRARRLPRGRDGRPDRGPRRCSTPAPAASSA